MKAAVALLDDGAAEEVAALAPRERAQSPDRLAVERLGLGGVAVEGEGADVPDLGQQDEVGAGDAVDQRFRARPVPGLAPVAGLELD